MSRGLIEARIENPDAMVIEVKVSLSTSEWRDVVEALKQKTWHPCGRLADGLRDVLIKALANTSERVDTQ